MIGRPPLMRS